MDNKTLAGVIGELASAYKNADPLTTGKRVGSMMELVSGVVFSSENWTVEKFREDFSICRNGNGYFRGQCADGCTD